MSDTVFLSVTCSMCCPIGLLAGLLVAVIINLIKKNKGGFPLIPYLAIGYMMAYFI